MYFPLYLDLTDKEILLVGAGNIAERRLRALIGFVGKIRVIADHISPEILALADARPDSEDSFFTEIFVQERKFQESDLSGADYILAATDDEEENRKISALAREKKIPVNVCTDADLCDFQFPSVIECGMTVIGINSSGKNHALVKKTRKRIESRIQSADFKSKYR